MLKLNNYTGITGKTSINKKRIIKLYKESNEDKPNYDQNVIITKFSITITLYIIIYMSKIMYTILYRSSPQVGDSLLTIGINTVLFTTHSKW